MYTTLVPYHLEIHLGFFSNKFFVIEKDHRLIEILKQKFKDKVIIINNDILKVREELISEKKLIVFGNLPYNISTKILSKWITNKSKKN